MKNPYYSCKSYLQENSFCFWHRLLFSPYPRLWFNLIGLGNLHKFRRCFIHHSWLAKPNMKFGSFLFLWVLGCNLAPGVFSFSNMTAAYGGCHTGKREDSGDELGEDLPSSAPLRSLPPINNSPLKNLNRLNQSREVKLTKQYNSRVLFFLPSCVGAAVLNLANKSVQKVSQHSKILIAAANVLTFNEFKSTWKHTKFFLYISGQDPMNLLCMQQFHHWLIWIESKIVWGVGKSYHTFF